MVRLSDHKDGQPAVGHARTIPCPVCVAPAGTPCKDSQGYHVERGRQARWAETGISTDQPF